MTPQRQHGSAVSMVPPYHAKTHDKSEREEPQQKGTMVDASSTRIVVVGPYQQINMFLESAIPKYVQNAQVDVVARAETSEPPLFSVEDHERHLQTPAWVFDFGRLMVPLRLRKYDAQKRQAALGDMLRGYVEGIAHDKDVESALHAPLNEDLADKLLVLLGAKLGETTNRNLIRNLAHADRVSCTTVKEVVRVQSFRGYEDWTRSRNCLYITPVPLFEENLKAAERYDDEGDYLPASASIVPYSKKIIDDLDALRHHAHGRLQLFQCRRHR